MPNLLDELEWLKRNPAFEERPATFYEFLGPEYLNVRDGIRKRILYELTQMFGEEVNPERIAKVSEACVTGGIGIGKTTIASIVLPYMVHWALCLKNPQEFYGLLAGSRIAFMQMSTSEKQALEVVFGDLKARIQHSPWFMNRYPPDPQYKNQMRFDKDIWVIPGDSAETTFEGYNILGGVLDEGDSHKITKVKDYAEQGYTTISSRITSRFQDRGFLLVIGQMKRANGFMARKYADMQARKDAYAVRLSIWESMGPEFYKDKDGGRTFSYDTLRKQILPSGVAKVLNNSQIIEIPWLYKRQFEVNPEKALRDLAGIPPKTGNAFISLIDRILDCRDRWVNRYGPESPCRSDGSLEPWFKAKDSLRRTAHIDIGYAEQGDALGLAMGHVREVVDIDGELKPYIVFDLLMRLSAPPGREIFISDVRQIIYELRDHRKFKLERVTLDGFQSTDTMQQLQRRRFDTEYVSVDRQMLPYFDLRDAIYEGRLEFPPYMVQVLRNDLHETIEIAVEELSELVDTGLKVDHPEMGTKDVADAMAGVCFTLMGDRRFRRNVRDLSQFRDERRAQPAIAAGFHHPAIKGDSSYLAPLPPPFRRSQ